LCRMVVLVLDFSRELMTVGVAGPAKSGNEHGRPGGVVGLTG